MTHSTRRRGLFVALALLAPLAACGSAPLVHVSSQPETARIYVNGVLVGTTPYDVALPFSESERVYLQVVHPAGKLVGTQVITEQNLPSNGEVTFDLR